MCRRCRLAAKAVSNGACPRRCAGGQCMLVGVYAPTCSRAARRSDVFHCRITASPNHRRCISVLVRASGGAARWQFCRVTPFERAKWLSHRGDDAVFRRKRVPQSHGRRWRSHHARERESVPAGGCNVGCNGGPRSGSQGSRLVPVEASRLSCAAASPVCRLGRCREALRERAAPSYFR